MKKLLAVALLTFFSSVAFANQTNIELKKSAQLTNPTNSWNIHSQADIFNFYNTSNILLNVQVTVSYPMMDNVPDTATVICNGKDYKLHSGDSLVCGVLDVMQIQVKPEDFKNGSFGTYTVLE